MQDPDLNEQHRNILREAIIQVTDDKNINWNDIKEKVEQGDITYTFALALAKRRIEDYNDREYDVKTTTRFYFLYKNARRISYVLLVIYMCLSFFQKPAWCMKKPIYEPEYNSYYDNCSGTVLEGPVIIVSTIPYLQNWQLVLIEVFCVTFMTVRKIWQHVVEKRTKKRYPFLIATTLLIYLSEVLQYIVGIPFPFNQFLRPIFLMVYLKMVRRNVLLYFRIFWRSKEVFIVIAGAFMFYVCAGRIFFYQTPMESVNPSTYDTFGDAAYNLFVTLTTSNYPDTMMPIYEIHRFSNLYWITFMGIVNMVLLNIIMAYFFFNYKNELMEQASNLHKSKSIDELFNDLHFDDPVVQRRLSKEATDMSKMINEIEKTHTMFLQRKLRRMPTKKRKLLLETLNSFPVRTIFAFGSLLIFIFVAAQANEVSPSPQPDYTSAQVTYNTRFNQHWIIILFILNIVVSLDPFARVFCIGWKFTSKFLVLETLLSVATLTLLVINVFYPTVMSREPVKFVLLLRLLRFLKWVYSFEKYSLFFNTLRKMFALFKDLLAVLAIVVYFYITSAECMFGGYLKTNSPINFTEYGDPEYYLYVNFNDFYMGLFVCFHLLTNNWLYTSDVHCRVMGSFAYRTFFVSYYIVVVMICFNILIAFLLEVFITTISNKTSTKEPEDKKSKKTNSKSESGSDDSGENSPTTPSFLSELQPDQKPIITPKIAEPDTIEPDDEDEDTPQFRRLSNTSLGRMMAVNVSSMADVSNIEEDNISKENEVVDSRTYSDLKS